VGEGCGVVVLKRLQQAIKDNNKIYGVIDGSALNNDGNTMGITTPNPEAQKELIEKAIADAHIHPETISYVEAHGTGTLIGDPIELKALTTVFSKFTGNKQFCGIGSVKSNIGHLISAAGIASFIKVLLSMSSGELPATLHCSNPNPRFNFDDSPFYIVKRHSKWTGIAGILRAGISSFGLGGNNAHIIVSNEGVPHALQAVLSSDDEGIRFNRRRYWPEPMDIPESIKPVTRKAEEWKQGFFEPIEIYREGKLQ
jgi:acyl transferase domain-containing protein